MMWKFTKRWEQKGGGPKGVAGGRDVGAARQIRKEAHRCHRAEVHWSERSLGL